MDSPSQSPPRIFDCEAQAAVLIRASIYGIAGALYFAITLFCTQWMNEPDQGALYSLLECLEDAAFWLPGLMLLAPIAAYDLYRLTKQFTSPILRLQREMQALIDHQSIRPLPVQNDEHWAAALQAYNQIRGELLLLRKRLEETPVSRISTDHPEPLTGVHRPTDALASTRNQEAAACTSA